MGTCLRGLGVPAFADDKDEFRHGRMMPLLWMLAFEVGAATWVSEISAVQLGVAAVVLLLLSFLSRPASASALSPEATSARWWLVVLFAVPITVFAAVRATVWPLRDGEMPWLEPHPWSDTLVILVSLYAAAYLLLTQAGGSTRRQHNVLLVLLWLLPIATLVATVYPTELQLGEVDAHISLPALYVAVFVLGLVLALPNLEGGDPHECAHLNLPVALMILLFGLTNGLLVYMPGGVGLVIALAGALMVVWAFCVPHGDRTASGETQLPSEEVVREHVRRQIEEPTLGIWLPLFLLAFPVLALSSFAPALSVFGEELDGWAAALGFFLFNAAYLTVARILVRYGVDHLVVWVCRESWRNKGNALNQITSAAPLLIIFVVFFGLAPETWQVAQDLPGERLFGLVALLVALAVAVIALSSVQLMREYSRFRTWSEVARELRRLKKNEQSDQACGQIVDKLLRVLPVGDRVAKPLCTLSWRSRVNALLVIFVFQSFLFLPVSLALLAVYVLFAGIAVRPEVAAVWVFGDGQEEKAREFARVTGEGARALFTGDPDILASPWLRVPILLTAFSVLYLTAQLVSSQETRAHHFSRMETAMRGRFALRLALLWVRAGTGDASQSGAADRNDLQSELLPAPAGRA